MYLKEVWVNFYHESFTKIPKYISNLDGIVVGLNTNIDAIVNIDAVLIQKLVNEFGISVEELLNGVENWKGNIENINDYVIGLCGCFIAGKASEWIIQNESVYNHLLNFLPINSNYYLGGQAGIMSSVLAEIGVPRIIVHSISLPLELRSLFSDNKNIVVPILTNTGDIDFIHPKNVECDDKNLYLHIISEFKKNDILKITDDLKWICPRSNRFISTYDPLNEKMTINEGFSKGIEKIARFSNGIIISGFHMLDIHDLGIEVVKEKISDVLDYLKKIKEINSNLVIQLELSSTKNEEILEELINLSSKEAIWDSMSCNDRELAEILEILGEHKLANNIRSYALQESIFEGSKIVYEKLSLKRLHIHEYGCYIVLIQNDNLLDINLVREALCYASIITANRAEKGEKLNIREIKLENWEPFENFELTKEFDELTNSLAKGNLIDKDIFRRTGIAEFQNYYLVAIPTILIKKPKHTVGLGDTVSATAFAVELSLKKIGIR